MLSCDLVVHKPENSEEDPFACSMSRHGSDGIQPRSTGKYLRSMTASRKEIIELTFEEAAQLAEDGEPLFECIKDDVPYTAYTDCDHYCDTLEKPSDDVIDDVQEQMMNNLGHLINDQFTDEHKGTFGIATRHGMDVKKQVYKLSWRCYFFGFIITPAEMKKAIVQKGLDKGGSGSLDSSPYSKNQLLGCVGFPKSKTDKRVLVPLDESMPLEKFMVQNITGKEVELKYEDPENGVEEIAALNCPPGNFDHPRFAPPWDVLEKLVMGLDVQKRCSKGTYLSWARIGWAINGVSRAAKRFSDGLKLWLKFCRQCNEAYLEDPMKARFIYSGAKTQNQQLGWTSLMEALREDDIGMYEQIAKQLRDIGGAEITDKDELKIIKKFVYTSFHHKPNDIGQIIVKTYDDGNYIIVNTTEDRPYCPLFEGEHEPILHPYVVISLKTAKNKCRHPDCKDKTDIVIEFASYPLDLKTIVTRLLRKVETPEEAISKFVRQRKAIDFPEMTDSDLELDVPKSTIFGQRYPLVRNTFCLICKCRHDRPENCIFVNRAANLLAMECRLNHDSVHPPDGILVPQNITNVIIQNNYIHADREDLEDDIFDEEFHIFPDSELNRLVNISLKGFASDVARVFVHLGRDLFGVQTGDRDTWWAWDTQEMRWLQSQHKANIFCDSILAEHYARVMTWLRLHSPDNDKRTKRLQRIEHLLKRLKDRDQHSILAQAAILLKEEKRNFEFMLDANKDLLNFKGQVFDFEEMAVRDIRPTDYVSLSTGYELPEINLAKRTKVMTIIQSIMPDRQHVDYLLLHLAGCLDGWNREETFSILSGTGRNGKGILSLLMENALGKTNGYFKDVKAELLTKERPSADRPVPELLSTNGKRLIVASEPEAGSKINTGFLKFLTGNDPISGRWLHGNNEISFSPQHSLWLLCNTIPSLEAQDEAVWDRSRVIEFPFRFVDHPRQDTERKIDRSLKKHLPALAPQLMLVLLEAYGRYKREGLNPTPRMQAFTQGVREENDPYSQYIDSVLEVTCDDRHRLVQSDVETACKEWMKSEFRHVAFDKKSLWKALTDKGVIRKAAVRIGTKTPQGFSGVRRKDDANLFISE